MLQRNRAVIAMAFVAVLASAGPVAGAAAAKFILGAVNTAAATTTVQMAAPGAVLNLQNSGSGTATGLNVAVPDGQAPITVNAGAGTATNLDADSLDGHDASDFVQGPAEPWHEVGAAGEPGWGRFSLVSYPDPASAPVAFMKDPFGFVHLQGRVFAVLLQPDGCDTYPLFTLPAGYRPSGTLIQAVIVHDGNTLQNGLGEVDLLADGTVGVCSPRLVEHSWVGLDGITFRAAP